MNGLILMFLLVFAGCVFRILISQNRRSARKRPALPEGSVQMPLDMLTKLLDDLETARLHAGRLRLGMTAMIDNWPGTFSPEELGTAQALVNEAAEVGL